MPFTEKGNHTSDHATASHGNGALSRRFIVWFIRSRPAPLKLACTCANANVFYRRSDGCEDRERSASNEVRVREMGETMSLEMENIADQIRRAFRGESWHGRSVREVLAGVSAEDAAAHPMAGAHSIWEIVLHLTGGYMLVLRRVRGERAQLSPEEEWPPVAEFSYTMRARSLY
jgi:hypothetical protein